jgi:hypothetical protein
METAAGPSLEPKSRRKSRWELTAPNSVKHDEPEQATIDEALVGHAQAAGLSHAS